MMHKTLKNGVGLFQQLAHQKMGSDKKENSKPLSRNTSNFEYCEQKKENAEGISKNSFATLIQNVKEIESIQASKANQSGYQMSIKTVEFSNQLEAKLEGLKLKRKQT